MKKLTLYLLLLTMLLSLVACGGGGGGTETTTDTESESVTDLQDPPHPLMGLSGEEIKERYPYYQQYEFSMTPILLFFTDENNCPTILEMEKTDDDRKVAKVTVYPARTKAPSDEDFQRIEVGMSFYEVTELVGFPDHAHPNMYYYYYYTDQGEEYMIGWKGWYDATVRDIVKDD